MIQDGVGVFVSWKLIRQDFGCTHHYSFIWYLMNVRHDKGYLFHQTNPRDTFLYNPMLKRRLYHSDMPQTVCPQVLPSKP